MLFHHDGDAVMTVETEIRIAVTFLFFTLYTYRLDASETWRRDRLFALESTTDDDGILVHLRLIARDGSTITY